MDTELYEKLTNVRFGIWMIAIGVLAIFAIIWQQQQRIEVLDLKVQAMAKQLAIANERKDG